MCFFVKQVTGFPLLSKSSLLNLDEKKGLTNDPICCHGFLFSDKMFPALGFGAQLPPDWKVCVCLLLLLLLFVCVCVCGPYTQIYEINLCMCVKKREKGRGCHMQTNS